VARIDVEDIDGRTSAGGQADKLGTLPRKVTAPALPARIEQNDNAAHDDVAAAQITGFGRVAFEASPGEVSGIVGAVVLPGNDVLDVKTEERLIRFVQPAILAALAGPQADEPPKPTVSCGLPFACQENAGLGLQDGDEVIGHEVHFILAAFLRRQFALVAFVGEFADAGLRLAVSFQCKDLLSRLRIEGGADRFEYPIQEEAVAVLLHARIIPLDCAPREGFSSGFTHFAPLCNYQPPFRASLCCFRGRPAWPNRRRHAQTPHHPMHPAVRGHGVEILKAMRAD